MGYLHWMMAVGVLLVVSGVLGLISKRRRAARRNRLPEGLR